MKCPGLGYPLALALATASACGGVAQPSELRDPPPSATAKPPPPPRPPPPTSPISGRVVDGDGVAASGISVIQGDQLAVTDATGAFAIAAVPAIYDLVVVDRGSMVYSIQGMTTRAPGVSLWRRGPGIRVANVRLALTQSAGVGFSLAATATGSGVVPVAISYPDWNARGVEWRGSPTATAQLTVLRYDTTPSGAPLRYTGFATVGVSVVDGDDKTIQVEPLAAPTFATRSVSGLVDSIPSGYSPTFEGVISLGATLFNILEIPGDLLSDGTGSVLLPDLLGASYALTASAYGPLGECSNTTASGNLDSLVGAHIALEPAVMQTSPPNEQSDVTTSTPFTWSGSGSDPISVIMDPQGGPGPIYILMSATGAARIPDASLAGEAFPSGVRYTWFENHWHGLADVDALAAGGLFTTATSGPWSQNRGWFFTMAP